VIAFDKNSLEKLLLFKLGKDLCVIVNCSQGFGDLVLQLLKLAVKEGWIKDLLSAIAAARANIEELIKLIREHFPDALVPIPAGSLTAKVRVGLETVAGHSNDPGVREILSQYRSALESAREGATALNQYKILHDTLHTLQQQLSGKFEDAADQARKGELTADVDMFVYHLREAAEKAREAAQCLKTQNLENAWATTLDQIASLVKEGQAGKPGPFDKSSILFRRVLSEAPRISAKMTDVVANLRLDGLREALKKIREQFKNDPAEQELTTAIEGLTTMQPRLAGLVQEHTEWQIIDKAVAIAEVMDGSTIEDRFLEWSDTHRRLETLFDLAPNKPWADMLKGLIKRMEAAGAARDAVKFEIAFESFCSVANQRFVNVDKQLLERSGHIATVAPILARLL
jgi:Effector-associated domain 1